LIKGTIANTVIYDNTVAIFIWDEKPVVLKITNRAVSQAYKKYFEVLWKEAKDSSK
jgi:hypothetical protein